MWGVSFSCNKWRINYEHVFCVDVDDKCTEIRALHFGPLILEGFHVVGS